MKIEKSETNRGFGVDTNRMHLTQDQVASLLPILKHFAENGELPRE